MSDYVDTGAIISADGRYRYRLWREWRLWPDTANWYWWQENGKPVLDGAGAPIGEPKSCVFIMLNPSTADADADDATIRRCVAFAKRWKYDRLDVFNLFAYRATDPRALLALNDSDDPVGPKNLHYLQSFLEHRATVGHIICAWGNHGAHLGQDETMLGWLQGFDRYALKLSKDGHPAHPLYLPTDSDPIPFRPDRRAA